MREQADRVGRRAEPVWRSLFEAEGLALVRVDYPPDYVHARHAHDYMSVTLMLAGGVEEEVGGRSARGGPLAIVLKDAGVDHACRWGRRGARTLSVELDPEVLARTAPDHPRRPWAWLRDTTVAATVISIYHAARRGRLDAEVEDAVLELLAGLVPPEDADGPAPPWLREAVEALRDASPTRPTTHTLAERAGVHPVHFARVFRRHVGCAPTEFARRLRLEAVADALVLDARGGVSPIAHANGFADHSHLCRELRTALDLTPTAFRALGAPVGRGFIRSSP